MHSAFSHPFAPPTERTILRAARTCAWRWRGSWLGTTWRAVQSDLCVTRSSVKKKTGVGGERERERECSVCVCVCVCVSFSPPSVSFLYQYQHHFFSLAISRSRSQEISLTSQTRALLVFQEMRATPFCQTAFLNCVASCIGVWVLYEV